MAYTSAQPVIQTAFAAAWPSDGPPIVWDNMRNDNTGPFCRVWMDAAASAAPTFGSPGKNTIRVSGNLFVEMFLTANVGSAEANRLIEVIIAAFQMNSFAGDDWCVRFAAVNVNNIGQTKDSKYHQVNVIVPYTHDYR